MKEQNNNINTDSFPKIREFKNKLLHYYADTNILEDDSIYQLCCNILSVDGAESPLVVLPDVSKKNERISPTGITLSSHSHIIPSALPAANEGH
jgi:hypothetical protein